MVLAHWCKLIDGPQVSPMEFYRCVEEPIERRRIPSLAKSHVEWPEKADSSPPGRCACVSRERGYFSISAAAAFGILLVLAYPDWLRE